MGRTYTSYHRHLVIGRECVLRGRYEKSRF